MSEQTFDITFSRGIDPSCLDPTLCHSHPEVPPAWPSRAEVESYVAGTRQLLLAALRRGNCSREDEDHTSSGSTRGGGNAVANGHVGTADGGASRRVPMRAISLCLEHERMHCETLCHMLAQQRRLDREAAAVAASAAPAARARTSTDGKGISKALPMVVDHPCEVNIQDLPGGGLQPPHPHPGAFYLAGCSYASTALPDPPLSGEGSPPEPRPPERGSTPGLAQRLLAALALEGLLSSSRQPPPAARAADGRGPPDVGHRPAATTTAAGAPPAPPPGLVRVPRGDVVLGVDPDTPHGFAWDVELGREGPLAVGPLLVAPYPVTVSQFRQFALVDKVRGLGATAWLPGRETVCVC